MVDLEGKCTLCNASCLSMLGYSHESQLLGKNLHDIIHYKHPDGTHYPEEQCRIFQAFKKGQGTHVEDEVLWRADGTCFPVEYFSCPQYRNGRAIGAVVTFTDITERKKAERELRKAREARRYCCPTCPVWHTGAIMTGIGQ